MMDLLVLKTYKEAVEHVSFSYWVEPFMFAPGKDGDAAAGAFALHYVLTDESDLGMLHYSKKW